MEEASVFTAVTCGVFHGHMGYDGVTTITCTFLSCHGVFQWVITNE